MNPDLCYKEFQKIWTYPIYWAFAFFWVNVLYTLVLLAEIVSPKQATPVNLYPIIPSIQTAVNHLWKIGNMARADLVIAVYSFNWLGFIVVLLAFSIFLFIKIYMFASSNNNELKKVLPSKELLDITKNIWRAIFGCILFFCVVLPYCFIDSYTYNNAGFGQNRVFWRDFDLFRYAIMMACQLAITGIVIVRIAFTLGMRNKYGSQ
jgi:hypothetical protein